jgi:hypothetical protein
MLLMLRCFRARDVDFDEQKSEIHEFVDCESGEEGSSEDKASGIYSDGEGSSLGD